MKTNKLYIALILSLTFFVAIWLNTHYLVSYASEINVQKIGGCNVIKSSNDFDDDTTYKDKYDCFMQAYYNNLNVNMGVNVKGSCGYVAMTMLLSYYDTYLNDDIISDEYDAVSIGSDVDMNARCNSPGTYYEYFTQEDLAPYGKSNEYELTSQEYYEIVAQKAEKLTRPSFHSKLITIG